MSVEKTLAELVRRVGLLERKGERLAAIERPVVLWAPDVPPVSPTSWDEEFNTAALDAKWTLTTSGAPTIDYNTTRPSCAYVKFDADGWANWMQSYAPGAVDFSVTAKFSYILRPANPYVDLRFYNAAESEGIFVRRTMDSAAGNHRLQLISRDASVNTTRSDVVCGEDCGWFFLHVQRVGTSWQPWLSFDGYGWRRSNPYAKSFTLDHVEIMIAQGGSTTVNRAVCDWIRFNWQTL